MADQDNDSHVLLVAESEEILGKGFAIVSELLSADERTRAKIRREQLVSVHAQAGLTTTGAVASVVGSAMAQIYERAEKGGSGGGGKAEKEVAGGEEEEEDGGVNMLNIDESMMTPYGPPNPNA